VNAPMKKRPVDLDGFAEYAYDAAAHSQALPYCYRGHSIAGSKLELKKNGNGYLIRFRGLVYQPLPDSPPVLLRITDN